MSLGRCSPVEAHLSFVVRYFKYRAFSSPLPSRMINVSAGWMLSSNFIDLVYCNAPTILLSSGLFPIKGSGLLNILSKISEQMASSVPGKT